MLRRLRRAGDWTPVILLTQVGESTERAMALEEGADVYLKKPFDPHELVARIRAVLLRARPGQPSLSSAPRLVSGHLSLDRRTRRAHMGAEELHLTPKAMALLEYLITHPVAATLLAAMGIALWEWAGRRCQERMADTRVSLAQERRQFLQRIDHELKNPLIAIRVGLANVANGASGSAQQEALAGVEAQVLRISPLPVDLRKSAELETRPLDLVPVNVADLLQEVVGLAQQQPGASARRLVLVLPQAPWPVPDVLGDRDLFFLATYNLLDNALKFTWAGDTVKVRAGNDRTFVTIEVADTGPGLPREELPRVWEELYRGQGARGGPGSGLGLALVRAIVDRHGGQAILRSRAG